MGKDKLLKPAARASDEDLKLRINLKIPGIRPVLIEKALMAKRSNTK